MTPCQHLTLKSQSVGFLKFCTAIVSNIDGGSLNVFEDFSLSVHFDPGLSLSMVLRGLGLGLDPGLSQFDPRFSLLDLQANEQ